MSSLPTPLRRQLERAAREARNLAVAGARKALEALAVHEPDPYRHMDEAQRTHRRKLRAQAKQLGDGESQTRRGAYAIEHLVEKLAYDQWHRLLFARFLLENDLLISPEHGVSVSLDDCEELGPSLGLKDAWAVAARFAAVELPEIFRADDPAGGVELPLEDRQGLIQLVTGLPVEVFTATDSLGWCYQFWQAERKDQVNAAGNKIGADELPAVTQLFTEDYMVDFLLDNTLGAWWAGKVLAEDPALADTAQSEDQLRQAVALPGCPWRYLRFVTRPSRSGEVARPSRSGEVARPSRSGEVARPSRSGEVAGSSRSGEVARPSRSGKVTRPSRSGEVARPSRSGFAEEPDRDGLATLASLAIYSGENLPHWICDHAVYHVSFRLADSVPLSKREEWLREREHIAANAKRDNRALTAEEEDRIGFLYSERIEQFLDSGHGECLLKQPEIAELVAGAVQHFEGQRYTLYSWCVMPNHVHVIVEPLPGHDLSKIIHSWKSFTAHEINKRLRRTGDVWQHDAYNHIIRSEKEYRFQIAYVWENPDKAGLPDWKWRWVVTRPSRSGEVARPSRSGEVTRPSRSGEVTRPSRSGFDEDPDRDGLATTGTFGGWPRTAKELKCLDPCMGSGHFVVAMFERLVALRLAEEELDEAAAVAAVIRDNLFGLEIDPRCTQIAAFNLALAAWRRVGHCRLPAMNLACSGLAPNSPESDWLAIVGDDEMLQRGMERLYRLFQNAPVLGSLIDPRAGEGDLLEAGFHELQPLLERALARESQDDSAHEMAVTARGVAKAAEILAGQFMLVATNVPYLGRGKQDEVLKVYCERVHPEAKADLATCFVERSLNFCQRGGSTALVTPQNWLFLGTYKKLRQRLLEEVQWDTVARLGPRAFETIGGEVVNVALLGFTSRMQTRSHEFAAFDVAVETDPDAKAKQLLEGNLRRIEQHEQLRNPDARIVIGETVRGTLLNEYADSYWGLGTGDFPRFGRSFWEFWTLTQAWSPVQSTIDEACEFGGCELVVLWEQGRGTLMRLAEELRQIKGNSGIRPTRGAEAWGKRGICVSLMCELLVTRYEGHIFDGNCAAVIPKDIAYLPAVWAFCSSPEFSQAVRAIDQKVNVTNHTLLKVPFDLVHWQKVAAEKYPNGLPKPFSSDPTQWLFDGSVTRPSRSGEVTRPSRSGEVTRPSRSGFEEDPDRDGLATNRSGFAEDPDRDGLATNRSGFEEDPDRDGLATPGLATLNVAVARLLGYQWPRQTGSSFPDCPALDPDGLETLADEDGIVPISPAKGEAAAAERLRELLARAFGADWSAARLEELLAQAGYAGASLEDWLRNGFFEQHCKLFHHRPFIWHLWDGHKSGFSVLVNYHKLTQANLEKLTYSYLGDWMRRQQAAVEAGEAGSDAKLQAAKQLQATLKLILEGEPPYDLFVRWKPLSQQAIGWQPDLNDGVRMNIRPFMLAPDVGKKGAGILRTKPNIKWEKDRGKEPVRDQAEFPWFYVGNVFTGDRVNDVHLTKQQKERSAS